MAKTLQLRRGTAEEHSAFIGEPGEITLDTDLHMLRIHDGETPGGIEIALGATAWTQLNALYMGLQGWRAEPKADNPEEYDMVLDFGLIGDGETTGAE